MAHKTLVDGTAYEVSGGRTLVGGTGYDIAKGRTLVDGTGYDISFKERLVVYDGGSDVLAGTLTLKDLWVWQTPGGVTSSSFLSSCYDYARVTADGLELVYSRTTSGTTFDKHTGYAYIEGIDFTKYSTLKIETKSTNSATLGYTSDSIPTSSFDSSTSEKSIDISGIVGTQTIMLQAYSGTATGTKTTTITKIWLEE